MSAIRLLLVDDNPEVLDTLADVLEPTYVIAGALSSGAAVVEGATTLKPDVVLLDISLRDMTGFEVARRLKKSGSPAKIIFLTVHENVDFVRAAFDLQAAGYVYKSRIGSDLIDAIQAVCEGKRFSSADVAAANVLG